MLGCFHSLSSLFSSLRSQDIHFGARISFISVYLTLLLPMLLGAIYRPLPISFSVSLLVLPIRGVQYYILGLVHYPVYNV